MEDEDAVQMVLYFGGGDRGRAGADCANIEGGRRILDFNLSSIANANLGRSEVSEQY